ncbi:MAG: rhodanese-like domain-containing protein [Pseudomonadota bacterium]
MAVGALNVGWARRLPAAALIAFAICTEAPAQEAAVPTPSGETVEEISGRVQNIGTDQLKRILAEDPNTVLIDVRTVREGNLTGGIIRAKRSFVIPRGWLEFRIADTVPDKSAPIVVYCGTNRRSPLAADALTKLGYSNVKNYVDGFPAWKKAGLPVEAPDREPQSFLYSKPVKVIEGVWSAIGATAPSTYQNAGHNNNLSFIITGDGVVVVNASGNYLLAQALHEEIRKITEQPVRYVILENGQGHAALGSSYWQERGIKVIAHADAAHELEERAETILEQAQLRTRDKSFKSRVTVPDETFHGERKVIELGGWRIELLNLGPAHSPGDIMVWLPQKSLIITGDMAFHERLLPVFEHTDTAGWLETWEKLEALKPKHVIPGHGGPTTMDEVRKYTKGYLAHMRRQIGELIENGGTLQQAYKVDQSAYEHLDTFEFLARQNAGRIFRSMEFE